MTAATATRHTADEDVRALVARAQTGDAEAFGAIYARYRTTIHRYLYRRVGNPTLAEDLTSEVFARALRGIARFTWQGRDPVVWLVAIANNLSRDHFRAAARRPETVSHAAAVLGQEQLEQHDPSPAGQPELSALAAATNAALREAIRRLTPAQQQCIALRFYGGLTTHETAARMGTTTRAVVSMQHRAVRALADTLPARAVMG